MIDFSRIFQATELIINSTLEELRNEEYLIKIIKLWGIIDDPVINFGYDDCRSNIGLFQQPEQLAPALIYLSKKKIKNYLEIGTFIGSSPTFISIYLSRFNKLHTLAVDRDNQYNGTLLELANKFSKVEFLNGTSNDIKEYKSDLCFIDADHKYESVKTDWHNVGKTAKICMFHDINDEGTVKDRDGSGTVKFWNEIKTLKCLEFKQHPLGLNVMGIGICR
jgi:hypothetical protein